MAKLNIKTKRVASENNLRRIISLIIGLTAGQESLASQCLRDYIDDGSRTYSKGEICIFNGYVWECKSVTTGAFNPNSWVKLSDEFTQLEKSDIEAMLNLSSEDIAKLSDILLDTEVRLDKGWSSSCIYSKLQQCLEDGKTFTLKEISKLSGASYKVVASTSEMTSESIIYLLPNATNYDMYIVEADGTARRIGDTTINLDNYFTKSEIEADYLKKTDADGKFATITTVDNHIGDTTIHITQDEKDSYALKNEVVNKTDIATTISETPSDDKVASEKAVSYAVSDTAPFKFGIDDKGNYGYYKAGADTVTPFRVEPTQFATGVIANLSSESITIDISKRYLVSVSLKYTEPNDTLRLNNFYVSDGIVQELIPSSLGYGVCTLSGNTLTIENTNTTTVVNLYICYTILEI